MSDAERRTLNEIEHRLAVEEPALADGVRLAQEGQEGGLKGVLDILFAHEQAPAHVPH